MVLDVKVDTAVEAGAVELTVETARFIGLPLFRLV